MNPNLSSSWHIFLSFIFMLILREAASGSLLPQDFYNSCNVTYSCGSGLTGIGYPFRGSTDPAFCGHPGFVLECNTQNNYTFIEIENARLLVLAIDQTAQTMSLVRDDMILGSCPHEMANTTLDFSIFNYTDTCTNYTFLYGCPHSGQPEGRYTCPDNGNVYVEEGTKEPGNCAHSIIVPVSFSGYQPRIDQVLWAGFEVRWIMDSSPCRDCRESNGRCGFDYSTNQTTCLCPDTASVSYSCPVDQNISRPDTVPSSPGNGSRRKGLEIGLPIAGAVLAGVFVGWFIFYVRQARKKRVAPKSSQTISKEMKPSHSSKQLLSSTSATFTRSIPSFPSERSEFGRDVSYFGVQVFDYSELEEATDNFNSVRELGDGGFGTVYYGKLQDGRKIAVKRLYENNFKRVEQFMNEVEILARLRHEHLVKLYGCTPKRSRELLLVYEYIPNGTVADHLHGNRAKSGLLTWPIRLNIAIETAEALAYLHGSDIIHRDVKTTNVLLDNDFHVKVADFGLSRLFPTNVTHVSTAPQGTPGYVDPEYYQCYHLTEKSDVYSFGVMMIELISSLQAVDTNRHRHDINLSNMAINKIQSHQLHELVDSSLGYETNTCVRRMITLVAELAFRCLQQERDMRPTMEEVLEGLRRIQSNDSSEHMVEIDITGDEDVDQLDCSIDLPSPVSVAN